MTADAYDVAHETALVGTGRARAADVEQAATALVGEREGTTPSRLLELAAAVTRVQRATAQPIATDREPVDPAPDEHREISRRTRSALQVALADASLQQQALGWVAELGLVLDADTTVRALEIGTARPGLRRTVARAIGARGRWLAGHNAAWSWATGGDEAKAHDWEHAPSDQRPAILRALRRRDPAAGRQLLERAVPGERVDALVTLVGALASGLGPDDEPLLEQLLDDKRVQVRRAAAAVLVNLPDSGLIQRVVTRTSRYLSINGRLRKSLDVRPPEEADAEMLRDAVPTDVLPKLGKSASLLAHELARVPPDALREVLGVDTARLVSLAVGSDWWPSFRHGLLESAQRWGDVDVLVALLPHVPAHDVLPGVRDDAAVAAVVTAELRRNSREPWYDRALTCLLQAPTPWAADTATALWPALLLALDGAEAGKPMYMLGEAARTAGRALPVEGQPLPLDPGRYTADTARRAAESVVSTFAVRQRLHQSLVHDAQENP